MDLASSAILRFERLTGRPEIDVASPVNRLEGSGVNDVWMVINEDSRVREMTTVMKDVVVSFSHERPQPPPRPPALIWCCVTV